MKTAQFMEKKILQCQQNCAQVCLFPPPISRFPPVVTMRPTLAINRDSPRITMQPLTTRLTSLTHKHLLRRRIYRLQSFTLLLVITEPTVTVKICSQCSQRGSQSVLELDGGGRRSAVPSGLFQKLPCAPRPKTVSPAVHGSPPRNSITCPTTLYEGL